MTLLAFFNNWHEFANISAFLVIAFVAWQLFQYIKYTREKSQLMKELSKECDELEEEVLSKYTEAEIENVRICKTLIWHLYEERKLAMNWSRRKEMIGSWVGSGNLWRLEQQMIIDGKKEGEINCIECHKKGTIQPWNKSLTDKSKYSEPDLAWMIYSKFDWKSLSKKETWSKSHKED